MSLAGSDSLQVGQELFIWKISFQERVYLKDREVSEKQRTLLLQVMLKRRQETKKRFKIHLIIITKADLMLSMCQALF